MMKTTFRSCKAQTCGISIFFFQMTVVGKRIAIWWTLCFNLLAYLYVTSKSLTHTFFKSSCRLEDNPICHENGKSEESYCQKIEVSQPNSSYVTERNNCSPSPCSSDQISSPNCRCAYPYTGTLTFTAPKFSDFGNTSHYKDLETSLIMDFHTYAVPVDSVSLSNPIKYPSDYFKIRLHVFPSGRDHFLMTEISNISYFLGFYVAIPFRPLYFTGDLYQHYAGDFVKAN